MKFVEAALSLHSWAEHSRVGIRSVTIGIGHGDSAQRLHEALINEIPPLYRVVLGDTFELYGLRWKFELQKRTLEQLEDENAMLRRQIAAARGALKD